MIPAVAVGEVHALCVGGLSTVLAAIDMATGRIEMGARGPQPQTLGRGRGKEAVECGQPRLVPRIQGTPAGVIRAMTGLNTWGNEARERLIGEKMGHAGALLVDAAQAVQDHGFDRMADGHHPHSRGLLRRVINDLGAAEFCKHPCDKAKVIEALRTV
jgi:hypothetical protein